MHTLVEPLYAADLYPWSETAGFVNVVLNLMTEEEPTGKMLRVYKQKKKKKKKNQDNFRSQMYVSSTTHYPH